MGEYTIEEHTLRSLGYEFDNYWGWFKITPTGNTLWIDLQDGKWRVSLASDGDTDMLISSDVPDLVGYLESLESVFFKKQIEIFTEPPEYYLNVFSDGRNKMFARIHGHYWNLQEHNDTFIVERTDAASTCNDISEFEVGSVWYCDDLKTNVKRIS